ncbi:hypothetical protein [Bordetella hinzii]|uniref:hypothetical protein n=1 Tax=Bordetella hinzii TaxID=103855 RepID=UPI000FDA987C|nr:hypothetical protein [Bordetella hinzii]MBZ0076332.1 hypothetical protein [Bordetella hinzii]MBZ0081074.1 hypothetical protein [Bordetella hinzii]MBZ0084948.1 hypothetical protein [Bordetella hinzii]QET43073.1 hypothetical protein FOB29_05340 [Bordetella hinzii]
MDAVPNRNKRADFINESSDTRHRSGACAKKDARRATVPESEVSSRPAMGLEISGFAQGLSILARQARGFASSLSKAAKKILCNDKKRVRSVHA